MATGVVSLSTTCATWFELELEPVSPKSLLTLPLPVEVWRTLSFLGGACLGLYDDESDVVSYVVFAVVCYSTSSSSSSSSSDSKSSSSSSPPFPDEITSTTRHLSWDPILELRSDVAV